MSSVLPKLACFLLVSGITGCAMTYDTVKEDPFIFGVSKFDQNAFVGVYFWNPDDSSRDITVPDECQGYRITQLGGYVGRGVPSPFGVNVPLEDLVAAEEYFATNEMYFFDGLVQQWDGYFLHDVDFNLYLGVNIAEIQFVSMGIYFAVVTEDNGDTFATAYRPRFTITCDEDNHHFYSLEGKLYERGTDTLCSEFTYVTAD